MNKALIIGGNGFVGRTWLESTNLEQFEEVLVLTSQEVKFVKKNSIATYVSTARFLQENKSKYDVIINLAQKRSAKTKHENLLFNCELPLSVIKKARHEHSRIINLSTYIQHYEISPTSKLYGYSFSKKTLSDNLFQLDIKHLIDISLFTLYGPLDSDQSLLKLFFSHDPDQGKFKMSGGDQLVAWTSVFDVINLLQILQTSSGIQGSFSFWPTPLQKLKESMGNLNSKLIRPRELEWGAYPYGGHELFKYDESLFPPQLSLIKHEIFSHSTTLLNLE